MSLPAQLYRLEQFDSEIDRSQAAAVEARRRQQQHPALDAAVAEAGRLEREEQAAAKRRRTLEAELETVEARIKRDQGRMYGGQIVDPRELASLEKELTHYRSQRDTLEEQVLEAMEHVEQLQEQHQTQQRQATELRARWESDQPDLARQETEAGAEVERLREARAAAAAELDARSLSIYTRLRGSAGHAVSAVSNGICQWCRVTIPPRDVQHARGGALVMCESCGRILYLG